MKDPVQGQLEAYNKHDIDSFMKYFSDDIEAFILSSQVPFLKGKENFYNRYSTLFKDNPNLHAKIIHRTIIGDHVLDEEVVEGLEGRDAPLHALAIYQIQGGLIQRVWFIRDE